MEYSNTDYLRDSLMVTIFDIPFTSLINYRRQSRSDHSSWMYACLNFHEECKLRNRLRIKTTSNFVMFISNTQIWLHTSIIKSILPSDTKFNKIQLISLRILLELNFDASNVKFIFIISSAPPKLLIFLDDFLKSVHIKYCKHN